MIITGLTKTKAFIIAKAAFCIWFPALLLSSCKNASQIYKSSCDAGITFKHVDFTRLIDSIKKYDNQYIEVEGTYIEGKEESALVNDSVFVDHSSKRAIWINFSQDCPLYLSGTHTGLFEFNDGTFTQINNKKITVRGRVDIQHTGRLKGYKATLNRISFIKL